MNLVDLLQLKFPNTRVLVDWSVSDKGDGIQYISMWNIPNTPQPTPDELTQWAKDLDLQLRQKEAIDKREYPTWQQQMDMLYHDRLNNTTVWQDTIAAIKTANPKPEV